MDCVSAEQSVLAKIGGAHFRGVFSSPSRLRIGSQLLYTDLQEKMIVLEALVGIACMGDALWLWDVSAHQTEVDGIWTKPSVAVKY